MDSRYKLRPGLEVEIEIIEPSDQLTLSPETFEKDNKVGSFGLEINSNTNWEVVSPQNIPSWISLSKTTGSLNDLITVDIALNDTGSNRSRSISIAAGTIVKDCQITQLA